MKNEKQIQDKIYQSFQDNLKQDNANLEILLGFSGGLDSCVLLHLLFQMQTQLHFKLKAIHIHHGLSSSADDWLNFCKEKCKSLNIEFYDEKVKINDKRILGIEGEARELRYQAIKKKQKGIVALGHHQNDQAETLMLQLLRGSGLKGLAGMPEFDVKRKFWRPMLNIKKEVLEKYANENNIKYIKDESNEDINFDRNFIRKKVLPLIESRYPASIETVSRSATNISDGHYLNEFLALDDSKNIMSDDGSYLLINKLKKLPKLRAINLLRWWLSFNNLLMPSKKNMDELYKQTVFIKKDTALNLKVSDEVSIRAHNNKLLIVKLDINSSTFELKWSGQEELHLPNKTKLQFIKIEEGGLSLSKLGVKTLSVKSRIGGEKLKPFSDQPSRSLKYLFQIADIPIWERGQIPLIFAKNELVAIPNLAVHHKYQSSIGEEGYQINWLRN
ncbi:tRNA lysidine(34) synthetase TilS [Methylophilales bacterium]|nr:tRNA lysidine(34) synthetase TilS [Methylophilales bacterium]